MLLMIDNYDSFTYNLVQYLGELGEEIKVFRNDKITIPEIEKIKPDRIVISPGPGTPKQAGISIDVIKQFTGKFPIPCLLLLLLFLNFHGLLSVSRIYVYIKIGYMS